MKGNRDAQQAAQEVLHFWFEELEPKQHWVKSDELDAEIGRRFGELRAEVLANGAAGWRDRPETLTAAIILLDQFSRNIFRGDARAFEADPLALELALAALDKGWTHEAPNEWRAFLLMPLMHSEDLAMQDRSVAEFEKLGTANNADFARKHRDQIVMFGRFPGRNEALGRESTAEELEALADGAAF